MLPAGSKVPNPYIRATTKTDVIHAVERANGPSKSKVMCGRTSLAPDPEMKRFQKGLGNECQTCVVRVTAARDAALQERKSMRSVKNQPAVTITVVADAPIATVKIAKPANSKRVTRPRNTAVTAKNG